MMTIACVAIARVSYVSNVNSMKRSIARGVGRKFLGGFQNGVSKTAGGLESTAPQTLNGISHFCTTFVTFFTKLTNDSHK